MRPQELFIDVVSGRFLDGTTQVPIAKPTIYSDEKKSILLNIRSVKNNVVTAFAPGSNSRYKFRIGTTSLKLADGVDVPSTPPQLFNATAIVTTRSPVAASARAVVAGNCITPTFTAELDQVSTATYLFGCSLDRNSSGVTATITVSLTAATTPITTTTRSIPVNFSFAAKNYNAPEDWAIRGGSIVGGAKSLRVLQLTPVFNNPVGAVFDSTISNGSVTSISITIPGKGYINGQYNLTISGGLSGVTIVTAQGFAITSAGIVTSFGIIDGGQGYVSKPIISLFTPSLQVDSIETTNEIGVVNGKKRFYWAEGVVGSAPSTPIVPIRFSEPDIYNDQEKDYISTPCGFLVHVQEDQWEINLISKGYGYSQTPTVTHDTAIVGAPEFKLLDGGNISISRTGIMSLSNGGAAHSLYNAEIAPNNFFTNINSFGRIFSNSFCDSYQGFAPLKITENQRQDLKTTIANDFSLSRPWNIPSDVNIDRIIYYVNKKPETQDFGDRFITNKNPTFDNEETYRAFSNTDIFIAIAGYDSLYEQNERLPLFKIEIPPVREEFVYLIDYENRRVVKTGILPGGIFEFSQKIIDGGNAGLQNLQSGRALGGFTGQTIQESPIPIDITVVTATNIRSINPAPYAPTIISSLPTVGTAPGQQSTRYFFNSPGLGFILDNAEVVIKQTGAISGGAIIKATATTIPRGYLDGEYDYQISAPSPGTAATIKLVVNRGVPKVVLLDGGNGYTSIPVITAPSPFISGSGSVATIFPIGVEIRTRYQNGYVSAGIIPGAGFVFQNDTLENGKFVKGQSYTPYEIGKKYNLNFEESPLGITARGSFFLLECNQTYRVDRAQTQTERRIEFLEGSRPFAGIGGTGDLGTFTLLRSNPPVPATAVTIRPPEFPPRQELKFGQELNARPLYIVTEVEDGGVGYEAPPAIIADGGPNSIGGGINRILVSGNYLGFFVANLGIGNEQAGQQRYYPLQIEASPNPGNGAEAVLDIRTLRVDIKKRGSGYLTPPVITGPAQLVNNGQIISISATSSFGLGYGPGQYSVTIATSPLAGGITASIIYNVSEDSNIPPRFFISNPGANYPTVGTYTPIDIIAELPSGSIVSGITIVCAGNFYTNQSAIAQIIDGSGAGCVLGQPIVSAGRIQSIPVLQGGYGYSNSPEVEINETFWPGPTPLDLAQIEGTVNITTASANAILTTANQRDVILEVYETDGTNEQVVVQGTMNLAKRVLS